MNAIYNDMWKVEKLPPIPKSITPVVSELELGDAMVIGGLSLIGDRGYMCPSVTILTGDGENMWGWSLCLGDPEQDTEEPYFFSTSTGTHRGTELPNTMTFFQAKVDSQLALEEADRELVDQVIQYVLPHISDDGPPPADGKSFEELVSEMSVSSAEHKGALLLKE